MIKNKKKHKRVKYPAWCQVALPSYCSPISVFICGVTPFRIGLKSAKSLPVKKIVKLSLFLPLTKKFFSFQVKVLKCEEKLNNHFAELKFFQVRIKQRIHLWREMHRLARHLDEILTTYSEFLRPEFDLLFEFEKEKYLPRTERIEYPVAMRMGLDTLPFPLNGFLQGVSLIGLGVRSR